MADPSGVLREDAGGVMRLVLDRPEKRNALTGVMYDALRMGLLAAEAQPAIRTVVIASSGPHFCAGNDIAEFAAMAEHRGDPGEVPALAFIRTLARFPKPLVAAVPGVALGVGATMLLHCDAVVVEAETRISAPFVRLGLTPEAGSSRLLPQRIGHARAFAVFALGEALTGAEAVDLGIANRCAAPGQAAAVAGDIAAQLAALPPTALSATKRLMRPADQIAAMLAAEEQLFLDCLRSPASTEAFRAFREKRPPDWRGMD